jgi:hypothetical protein
MVTLILSVLLSLLVGREIGKVEVRYSIRKGMQAVHNIMGSPSYDEYDDDGYDHPQWNEDQL